MGVLEVGICAGANSVVEEKMHCTEYKSYNLTISALFRSRTFWITVYGGMSWHPFVRSSNLMQAATANMQLLLIGFTTAAKVTVKSICQLGEHKWRGGRSLFTNHRGSIVQNKDNPSGWSCFLEVEKGLVLWLGINGAHQTTIKAARSRVKEWDQKDKTKN